MSTSRGLVRTAPSTVVAARLLLAVVSAGHLALALFTVTHVDLLHRDLGAAAEGLAPAAVEERADTAVVLALSVHVPLFVLTAVLAVVLVSGHPWALRPATVSQLFGIAFSTVSTPPFADLRPLIPVIVVVQAAVVLLLWAPRRSRWFFTAHPRSRTSRRRARAARTATASPTR